MQLALRPYASVGVALAGAGLIAITPVAAPPDIQARAVRLSASGSGLDFGDLGGLFSVAGQDYPIATPAQLVTDTVTNLEGLQAQFAADPAPILEQIIVNQAGYANDLATAGENASSDFVSAVQGLPDVLQNAATDFSSGDVYDGLFTPWSYVLTSALDVNHDLLNGTAEVVQGVVGNLDNVVNDTGQVFTNALINNGNAVPLWLTELIRAPLLGPNAAVAGFAGVTQDIVTAAQSGDYATALTDLGYAPSTITDAFLNGYGNEAVARAVPDIESLAMRLGGLNPAFGLLTGSNASGFGLGGGTIENILLARADIAQDLGAASSRAFDSVFDAQSGPLAEMLTGATATAGLPDLSTALGDLSTLLDPTTLLGDLTGLFDPSAVTDIGTMLGTGLAPDLSGLLLSLF